MFYKIGTILDVDGTRGKVIGYIQYANRRDNNNTWYEYRLKTDKGERWLSIDDVYKEYSVSWADNSVRGSIGPEWHEVDRGEEVVVSHGGDVDVDNGEQALFVEYEDETEEYILSSEVWSDGTEYSRGEYLDLEEIKVVGYEEPPKNSSDKILAICIAVFFVFPFIISMLSMVFTAILGSSEKSMIKFIKNSSMFEYQTSITGNEKQKADVYVYFLDDTTDNVAKTIIDGIEGRTESVTQRDEIENQEIAIVTKKEYCLVYHPEDDPDKVYVQVSKRKYNYASDNAPYKSSSTCSSWYRSHYYSSSYSSDSKSFKSTPSAYHSYDGATIHNIGNGYFDTYSHSVRQNSINSRQSSSGGISSGK